MPFSALMLSRSSASGIRNSIANSSASISSSSGVGIAFSFLFCVGLLPILQRPGQVKRLTLAILHSRTLIRPASGRRLYPSWTRAPERVLDLLHDPALTVRLVLVPVYQSLKLLPQRVPLLQHPQRDLACPVRVRPQRVTVLYQTGHLHEQGVPLCHQLSLVLFPRLLNLPPVLQVVPLVGRQLHQIADLGTERSEEHTSELKSQSNIV